MGGVVTAINAAVGQMTPAQQALYMARPSQPVRRRRKKSAAKAASRKGKKKRVAAKRARKTKAKRFQKGSMAAKRHMAKLRRLRRRK